MSEQWTHTLSSFQEEYALPYNTLRFIAQLLWDGCCRDMKGDVNALFHWCEMRHISVEELNEFVVQNTADVESGALAKEILAEDSFVGALKKGISQAKEPDKLSLREKRAKRLRALTLLTETNEERVRRECDERVVFDPSCCGSIDQEHINPPRSRFIDEDRKAEKKAKGKKNQKKKRATKQKKQDRNALSRDKSRGRPKTKQDNKGKK